MKKLINCVKQGNTVFVSAAILSYDVLNILKCDAPDAYLLSDNLVFNNNSDSFSVSLLNPPFSPNQEYGCPGIRFESYFSKFDTGITTFFGNGDLLLLNFIILWAGYVAFYFHFSL